MPDPPSEASPSSSSLAVSRAKTRVSSNREVEVPLVLVLVHLVLVVSRLEGERRWESQGGAGSVGYSSTLYICSNQFFFG